MNNETTLSLAIDNTKNDDLISEKWIGRLFDFFNKRYGLLWHKTIKESGMSTAEYRALWFDSLKNTKKMIFARAISDVKSNAEYDNFPPHLAKFNSLCRVRPTDLGFPSTEEAFKLFCNRKHQKVATIYHAVNKAGGACIRELPHTELKRRFFMAYNDVIDSILSGNTEYRFIPKPLEKLEVDIETSSFPKGYQKNMELIKKMLNFKGKGL